MVTRLVRLAAPLAAAAALCGCINTFESHSAYDTMRYICSGNDSAFDDLVQDCRALRDRGTQCDGVLSLRGVLDGVDLTLENRVSLGELALVRDPDGPLDRIVQAVTMYGRTPYFTYRLRFNYLGGLWSQAVNGSTLVWELSPQDRDREDQYVNNLSYTSIRLSSGGQSRDLEASSGRLEISQHSLDEVQAALRGQYGPTPDQIEGCFHVFFSDRLEVTIGQAGSF